jgi:hypothetical protein
VTFFLLVFLSISASCSNGEKDMIFDISEGMESNDQRFIFTKPPNADWLKPENQDRITENVWIVRANEGLLFNVKIDASSNSTGPSGTRWALGTLQDYTTEQLQSLEFTSLKKSADSKMREVVGKNFIVHLTEEDLYIDLTFLAWGNKSEGAGFSYSRSIISTP